MSASEREPGVAAGGSGTMKAYSYGQRIRHAMMASENRSRTALKDELVASGFTENVAAAGVIDQSFLCSWLDSGFQLIRVGPKLAALYAATTISEESLADFRWPWQAFVVETDDVQIEFSSLSNGHVTVGVEARGQPHDLTWSGPPEKMLTTAFDGDGDVELCHRLSTVALRIVLGACLALSTPEARHTAERRGRRERNQSPALKFLPGVRYVLGNDVKVDLTSHIREYVERGGSSPNVRTLVCGHHKWQAHGPQLTLRKYVWIQPYIRGPESAPMTIRAHSIADDD